MYRRSGKGKNSEAHRDEANVKQSVHKSLSKSVKSNLHNGANF